MSDFIVGLTGGIGSGKTTVSNMFADLGVDIVDADIVAREVVAPNSLGLHEIKKHFGEGILLANGQLNRKLLRQKIFANEQDKAWLNQLLHPLIREQILTLLKASQSSYCILSAPLLFENKLQILTNRSIVVDVPEEIQLERTCHRDNTNKSQVKSIMASQMTRTERLSLADDIIDNQSANLAALKQQVLTLHKIYLSRASSN